MSKTGFCLMTARLILAVAVDEARPSEPGSAQCERQKMKRIVKYRVARFERTVAGPSTLVLYVSIDPRHFNRDDMVLLAGELNRDFCEEPRLTVLIFSDYRAAKSLVFSIEQLPTSERDKAALRG